MNARPFLKWAGGKGALLPQIKPLLPPKWNRYFEPFVGGGAMFWDLATRASVLSDVNHEIVNCYISIRDDVESVIGALRWHQDRYRDGGADYYYGVRGVSPGAAHCGPYNAARTIFLNKTGYNGLYRLNRKGQFNVPHGRTSSGDPPLICDADNMRACSLALADAFIECNDFEKICALARPGDLIYFDPPYVPSSDTAKFVGYTASGFGPAEQDRLARLFRTLSAKGVYCVLSNSDTPAVRSLYAGFRIRNVSRSGSISCKAGGRGRVGEVVVTSGTWECAVAATGLAAGGA